MAYDERALRGVGGWLAFFVITLTVLGPLRSLVELVGLFSMPTPPGLEEGWPRLRALSVGEMLIKVALCAYLAWRLVARQTPDTPRIVIAGLWALALVVGPVSLLLVAAFVGLPLGALVAGSALGLGQSIGYALIWTLYLKKSRRVANTYTPDRGELHAVFE